MMALKYKDQAKAALRIAQEWEEMYRQVVILTHTKQVMAVSLQTSGEA